MASKGPKVRKLAGELGVTSRVILDRCRAEGVWVQNSISRLDAETERLVRSWFGAPPSATETDGCGTFRA